jgi:DNA-binding NtrC family response regulator
MARIALIDPSGRAATTVRAVLGRTHEIVVRSRVHAPGDVDLVIADLRYADLVEQGTLRGLVSFAPVLVLIDRREPVPPSFEDGSNVSVLKKPFEAFELRLKVEHLMRAAAPGTAAPKPRAEDEEAVWLEFPYVPAPAGAVLRRAAKLAAPLWIMGEPGSGRRHVALAVCRIAQPALRAVTLFADERLEAVLAREKEGGPFALFVPEIEERPLLEQERLATLLAGPRAFRLIATSIDDPAPAIIAGRFSRNLYRHLIGLAVQLSPLRERPIAIPPLAQAMARRIARGLGSDGELSFSPDAMARLQTYMWPGNLVELEAVLTRTLTSLAESELDGRTIEEHELLFTPEDAVRPRAQPRPAPARPERGADKPSEAALPMARLERALSQTAPRAGVEALRRMEAELATRSEPARRAEAEPTPRAEWRALEAEQAAQAVRRPLARVRDTAADAAATFETLIASLAHDLRNPMTAIKTFAGVIAGGRGAESAGELGGLASEACDRLEGYLQALQQYGSFGDPSVESVDVADMVRRLADEREAGERIKLDLGAGLQGRADPFQLRFVLDNLLAAVLAEAGERGAVTVGIDAGGSLSLRVQSARGAVAKLHRLSPVERQPVSWRVVLARAVAARNGWELDVDATADGMTIRCRPPRGEVETRGSTQQQQQTDRPDR